MTRVHPLAALDQLGGVARWSALRDLGVGRGSLLKATSGGDVARPARGVFCRPELVGHDQVIALGLSAQLTCASGASALGLDTWGVTPRPHLRTAPGPRTERRGAPSPVHAWGRVGSALTPGVVAVLHDCAACLPELDAVVIIDSALRRGLVDRDDWPAITLAGPHRRRVACVLGLVDPQAQSVLESVGRVSLVQAGVSVIQSQVWFADVGWVDLVVDHWLVIELDGRSAHEGGFQEDRRRDAELTRRGLVVLRFTYADLRHRLPWFVEVVQETLDRGRPPFGEPRRASAPDTWA